MTGYRVERCQGAGCTSFAQIATPTGTTFGDTGLIAATPYSYRVKAVDAATNVSVNYSTVASATTQAASGDTTPPSTVTGLTATAVSSSQINLSWTAATDNVGVTGYRVERCQGASCTSFVQIATPTGTTFSNTGLTAATSYSYRVKAVDAASNVSVNYSNVASATTAAPTTGLVAAYAFNEGTGTTTGDTSGNANTGTLTNGPLWTPTGKYGAAVSFDGVNDLILVPASASLNLTTAMTLEAWVNPAVTLSGWKAIVQKETDAYLLSASSSQQNRPAGGATLNSVCCTNAYATAALVPNTWTHVAATYNGTQMQLYINGVPVSSVPATGLIETTTTPLRIGGNTYSTEFFSGLIDEVRIYSRALSQAEIQTDMATPIGASDTTPPSTVTGLTATAVSATQINLSWAAATDNVGVTGYRVERCQGAGCTSFAQIATPTGTTFGDTGLIAATPYSYRVKAVDAATNVSVNYSTVASATTQAASGDTTPPSTVTGLTATAVSSSQINLSWTAATDNVGVTGYRVERCQGASCTSFVQIATPTGTTFSNTGLTAATSYSYRVKAVDAASNVSVNYSNVASATTAAPTTGLVAAYAFNEGTGTTTGDTSGNANTGTLTNGPLWTPTGKYGAAVSFDGVNDLILVPASASLNLTTAMTLEAWVNPAVTLSGWKAIVQKETDAYLLSASSSQQNRPAGGATLNSVCCTNAYATAALVPNTWTHVAATYNGTQMQLYINGVPVSSVPATGLIETTTTPLRIGGNTYSTEFFSGLIDEVRIYSRALSQAEIQTDMATPIGASDTTPPSTVTGLTATAVSATQINLSWAAATDNVGVTGYRVERCQGAGCTSFAQIATPTGTTFGDTGLIAATPYSYRVKAVDAATNVSVNYSTVASATTQVAPPDTTPPSTVTGLTATAVSATQINLSWAAATDNVGVTGYRVERCQGASCTSFVQVATPTGTSFQQYEPHPLHHLPLSGAGRRCRRQSGALFRHRDRHHAYSSGHDPTHRAGDADRDGGEQEPDRSHLGGGHR